MKPSCSATGNHREGLLPQISQVPEEARRRGMTPSNTPLAAAGLAEIACKPVCNRTAIEGQVNKGEPAVRNQTEENRGGRQTDLIVNVPSPVPMETPQKLFILSVPFRLGFAPILFLFLCGTSYINCCFHLALKLVVSLDMCIVRALQSLAISFNSSCN